jgi:SAM-dependent methyltransferase
MQNLKSKSLALLKEFSYRSGFLRKRFFSVYPFMFTPTQLMFIGQALRDTRDVPGGCLEVGCAYGATTVFLRKLMEEEGIEKPYTAIDTFSGFVPEQVEFEIASRRKSPSIGLSFASNKREWYETALAVDGVDGVRAVTADAAAFDYASLGKIAFCLLDVDLYVPIRDALPKIERQLAPGGVIVVDDCSPGGNWDGALQAYLEYCAARDIAPEIHCEKLGIVRKPRLT